MVAGSIPAPLSQGEAAREGFRVGISLGIDESTLKNQTLPANPLPPAITLIKGARKCQ